MVAASALSARLRALIVDGGRFRSFALIAGSSLMHVDKLTASVYKDEFFR
jgi:hypothetical protein